MTKTLLITFIIAISSYFGYSHYFSGSGIVIENAYVKGNISIIKAKDDLIIKQSLANDGDIVKRKELLIEFDTSQLELMIKKAEAKVKYYIVKEYEACINNLIQDKKAHKLKRVTDEKRKRKITGESLWNKQAISKESYQDRIFEHDISLLNEDLTKVQISKEKLLTKVPVLQRPKVSESINELKILVHKKKLLENTVSPISGIVYETKVFSGDFVEKGQELLKVIPIDSSLVEANVLETQIANLSAGQKVEVRLDTDKKNTYRGFVEQIFPISSASLSMLPANNINSNWIKVSQRVIVQVRILASELKNKPPLIIGTSASIITGIAFDKEDASNKTEHKLAAPQLPLALVEELNWIDKFIKSLPEETTEKCKQLYAQN